MRPFKERYGPCALVTGASSGIGAEFARQLAARGLNLVLVARRRDRLEALAAELEQAHGIEARAAAIDLSAPDFLEPLGAATAGREIGLVVSNAGYALTGFFLDNDLDDALNLLHLNVRAHLVLAHTYGRLLAGRGRGGLIFVASTVAFSATPYWTGYAASKAYTLALGEGLWYELKRRGVDVLVLCPGGTWTEFQQVSRTHPVFPMEAGPVVAEALERLGQTPSTIPGWPNKLLVFLSRFAPRALNTRMAGRVLRYMHLKANS